MHWTLWKSAAVPNNDEDYHAASPYANIGAVIRNTKNLYSLPQFLLFWNVYDGYKSVVGNFMVFNFYRLVKPPVQLCTINSSANNKKNCKQRIEIVKYKNSIRKEKNRYWIRCHNVYHLKWLFVKKLPQQTSAGHLALEVCFSYTSYSVAGFDILCGHWLCVQNTDIEKSKKKKKRENELELLRNTNNHLLCISIFCTISILSAA